ncbi:tetratricopeptide repeat protein 1-like [Ptychodera flava]|uniref:tetratricopeptide repeat protein 1-like n=1 Tax=Ptychodera flava TaxID=63121 RepID=UPI00396A817B
MATSGGIGDTSEIGAGDSVCEAEKLSENTKEVSSSAVEKDSSESDNDGDRDEFYDALDEINKDGEEPVRLDDSSPDKVVSTDAETTKEKLFEQRESTVTEEKSVIELKESNDETDKQQCVKDGNMDTCKDELVSEGKESMDTPETSATESNELQWECHTLEENDEKENSDDKLLDEEEDGDEKLPDEEEDVPDETSKPKPTTLEEDEEHLKELENSMTEEEKEMRKDEAQELKTKGNEFYKNEEYGEAIHTYGQALQICPLCYKKERAIMYSNRAACHLKLEEREEAIADCSKALELHPAYLKTLIRRAQTYEKEEKLDEALTDYQKVLELDPGSYVAREACMRLPEEIKERNEKLKDEMIGKLKDLGNLFLRPFGLSTNNFQLQQDPQTGSYSVNFQQNTQNNGK